MINRHMRIPYILLLLGSLSFINDQQVQAANCNSNGNGNWAVGSTWTCGNPPNAGDVITIEANQTVTVNTNLTYTGSPMHVVVYGTWNFSGGGAKITLECGSTVVLGFGGQVIGNGTGNSQTIRICSTTYWSASDGEVDGPWAWPETVMPVELLSFKATATGKKVDLRWSTGSERNSDSFRIDRSPDGQHWEEVASVPAAGNSVVVNDYQVTDQVPSNGAWYYQLYQKDIGGGSEAVGTYVVTVKDQWQELICGPRPAMEGWVDVFLDDDQRVEVLMYDMRGSRYDPSIVHSAPGRVRVDLSGTRPGPHVVTVLDEHGERRSCRVVVQ